MIFELVKKFIRRPLDYCLSKLSGRQVEIIINAFKSAGHPSYYAAAGKLDHVFHALYLSGELGKLSPQQTENIQYTLQAAGQLSLYKSTAYATYDDNLLMSHHAAEFLHDPLFLDAYQLGRATQSWVGFDKRWSVYVLCWAADYALRLGGDFVECGANGSYARSQMHYLGLQNRPEMTFYIFDSLWELPEKYTDSSDKYYLESYIDRYEPVCDMFQSFKNVKIFRGRLPDSLSHIKSEKISYLLIRMNSSEPEAAILDFLWPKLTSGAIIILDDTSGLAEQVLYKKEALQQFLQQKQVKMLALPTGQNIFFKV